MIQKTTLQFLSELKKNNTREWYESNRKRYEAAKENILENAAALIKTVGAFDTHIAELQPKDCVFRINRDVRFSKNKEPYKNNMSLVISQGGKKAESAAFYIHIEPEKAFIGTGVWAPEPKKLLAIRQEIDYNFKEFKKMLTAKSFTNYFSNGLSIENKLQRPPKGYEEDNPAIEFIKLKNFVATTLLTNADMQSKDFIKNITTVYKAAKPFINFLNTAD